MKDSSHTAQPIPGTPHYMGCVTEQTDNLTPLTVAGESNPLNPWRLQDGVSPLIGRTVEFYANGKIYIGYRHGNVWFKPFAPLSAAVAACAVTHWREYLPEHPPQ